MTTIATDYLVVGAGATAMAFVDTLLTETESTVVIADRRDHPGGHWNDAYPFIRLHAPSLFYGVASRPLGRDAIDTEGLNAGYRTLATKHEILDYYGRTMQERFLPSGRVTWLPKHEYGAGPAGAHRLRALLDGTVIDVTVNCRLVDAARSNIEVPATHPPRYAVAPGVALVPAGELVDVDRAPARFCIVGAGKTAMDCCLWLIGRGVDPSRIRWIKPRDSYVTDREVTRDFDTLMTAFIGQLRAIAEASSPADFYARVEVHGGVTRIDPDVQPTAFRCALLSRAEIGALRRIGDVVRLGRVVAIEPARIVLRHGTVAAEPDTLYVDCSASGFGASRPVPVFESGRINLQWVDACLPLFGPALTAFVESRYDSDADKNAVCRPVPPPSKRSDLLRTWKLTLDNFAERQKRPEIGEWVSQCRLNMPTALGGERARNPEEPLLKALGAAAEKAAARLPGLIAEADAQEAESAGSGSDQTHRAA